MAQLLADLLAASVAAFPDRLAVIDPLAGASLSYAGLDALSDQIAGELRAAGVVPGDRVGLCLPKSIESVASLFAILKSGAAYVPVDAAAPAGRNAFIFDDCAVAATIGPGAVVSRCDRAGELASPEGLAYILYTSGSTGNPKGVMLTHANALSFIDWCSETFAPTADDRFSSHAPFHFDLSILDLYVPIKHGGAIVLIGEGLGKNARELAPVIASEGITIWYSTPTVLRLLVEFGNLGDQDLSALRTVLFAGEVFPIKHLRALREILPTQRLFNLYGPTETNVCTAFEIPAEIPVEQENPFPIGRPCANVEARIEDGELLVCGGPVMLGYWNLPERTGAAFQIDADSRRWYRTGDIVSECAGGVLDFVGRRDRMVKRRGFRVELGEIEAGLYRHPQISEAATVALHGGESGIHIRAYIVGKASDAKPLNSVQMKLFCAKALLPYMIPDSFRFLEELPKTSTDKIDYQNLIAQAGAEGSP